MKKKEQYLWNEIYRPQTIDECILPEHLKKTFNGMVKEGEVSNLLLTGTHGIGKTTVAKALCNEIGADVFFINGSKDLTLVELDSRVESFTSTISMDGNPKVIIIDEADYIRKQEPGSVQAALRSFMETKAKNTRFILTCNYANKIIEPLHSRLDVIPFTIPAKEKPVLAKQAMKRFAEILDDRGIPYEKKALAGLIMKYLPDFRKMFGTLQKHARTMGKIDESILVTVATKDIDDLLDIIKNPNNYKEVLKWVKSHSDFDFGALLAAIKGPIFDVVADAEQYILACDTMNEHNVAYSQVADAQLHLQHLLLMLMQLDWKE